MNNDCIMCSRAYCRERTTNIFNVVLNCIVMFLLSASCSVFSTSVQFSGLLN